MPAPRMPAPPRWSRHGHPQFTDPHAPDAAARGACAARRGRAARAEQRPAPVRIPARALAGARVAVGLHRLDGHAGGRIAARSAVRRQPLLGAGRSPAGRQRHRPGAHPHRGVASAPGVADRAGAARRPGGGGRPGAGPELGAGAEGAARGGGHPPADGPRPAGGDLAGPPRVARAARVRARRTAGHALARRDAGAGSRGDGAPRREPAFRVHRRRHRVDHRPARQRRRIQPGVPGAPAAGPERRAALRRRSAKARSAPPCRPGWRRTACA